MTPSLPPPLEQALLDAARQARLQAVAPYSHFAVGAALLTHDGQIIPGANVESASYGLTCCAERVALFTALTLGHRSFQAVAVVADLPHGPTPCGACRQLLSEYAPHALVLVAPATPNTPPRTFTMQHLLPESFGDFRPPP